MSTLSVTFCFRYILQLALADSVFLLTIPFQVSKEFNKAWIFPEWMCKAKQTILYINYYASVLFLMVNKMSRYFSLTNH